jgi:hypothetical protein
MAVKKEKQRQENTKIPKVPLDVYSMISTLDHDLGR